MARTIRDANLETRTARARLKASPNGKPYWRGIDPGLHLGYRKWQGQPGGKWVARLYLGHAKYREAAINGVADDAADADGVAVLSYAQAQAKARALLTASVEAAAAPLTISTALDEYEADVEARGGDLHNAKRIRIHIPAEWLDRTVASLTSAELKNWRNALRKKMAASSVNRTGSTLRAMLNLAADSHALPARPWASGLASIPGATESRNVILGDATVRAIVDAAYIPTLKAAEQIRDENARDQARVEAREFAAAFGLFVEVAAVTGARPVQISRLMVADLPDLGEPRLMMPSSKKGKGEKKITRRPVPISNDLATRLREAAGSRRKSSPLLVKPSGSAWSKSDHSRPFARAVKAAGEDPAVATIYSLRHSSIVRQINANVPIRVVAATHDTSTAMIERHYSEHIADHADELIRATLPDFRAPVSGNVVKLPTR